VLSQLIVKVNVSDSPVTTLRGSVIVRLPLAGMKERLAQPSLGPPPEGMHPWVAFFDVHVRVKATPE
jgi:hypothetical protein